jgi:hypothetical protein
MFSFTILFSIPLRKPASSNFLYWQGSGVCKGLGIMAMGRLSGPPPCPFYLLFNAQ